MCPLWEGWSKAHHRTAAHMEGLVKSPVGAEAARDVSSARQRARQVAQVYRPLPPSLAGTAPSSALTAPSAPARSASLRTPWKSCAHQRPSPGWRQTRWWRRRRRRRRSASAPRGRPPRQRGPRRAARRTRQRRRKRWVAQGSGRKGLTRGRGLGCCEPARGCARLLRASQQRGNCQLSWLPSGAALQPASCQRHLRHHTCQHTQFHTCPTCSVNCRSNSASWSWPRGCCQRGTFRRSRRRRCCATCCRRGRWPASRLSCETARPRAAPAAARPPTKAPGWCATGGQGRASSRVLGHGAPLCRARRPAPDVRAHRAALPPPLCPTAVTRWACTQPLPGQPL